MFWFGEHGLEIGANQAKRGKNFDAGVETVR